MIDPVPVASPILGARSVGLRDVAFADRTVGLRRLETFVSRYTGVVSDVHEVLRRAGDCGLHRFGTMATTSDRLLGPELRHLDGASGGVDASRESARAAAIAEVLERYAASWTPDDSVVATADELGPEAVDPESFALYAPAQYTEPDFPFVPFTRSTRIRWIRGFSLPDGEPAWLPAQRALLSQVLEPDEAWIDDGSSNGLACGQTLDEATLSGLLETLERDAFVLTWLHRLSLPLLRWRDDPELGRLAERAFDPVRVSYDVIDLSGFWHVPTALAIVRGRPGDGAALGIGAASAATATTAVVKALGEAFCVRTWLLYLREQSPWEPFHPDGGGAIHDFADHVRYYGDEDKLARASFLWASEERSPLERQPRLLGETPLVRIEEICARLAARGLRAYAADVTSPDVARGGLSVVRAVVPGLLTIDANHDRRHMGGRRALTGVADARLGPYLDDVAHLNPDPHPFP